MESVYFYCSVIGGAVLLLQLILVIAGAGHGDGDVDLDGDVGLDAHADASDAFFKVLSLKTLVAFVTFFGLSGMASTNAGLATLPTLAISIGAGTAALYIVAWMMVGLSRLQSSGNVNIENAIGSAAKVYLKIPGHNKGRGKVTVAVQGRTMEIKALTSGDELVTGSMVRVVGAPAADTLEVVALEEGS